MPPAGFESVIPESEWPHTHKLDRAATGIGILNGGYNLLRYVLTATYLNDTLFIT